MNLLKDTPPKTTQPPVVQPHKLTITDGWNFGIGLWLALLVGMPLIIGAASCLFWLVFLILGISLNG